MSEDNFGKEWTGDSSEIADKLKSVIDATRNYNLKDVSGILASVWILYDSKMSFFNFLANATFGTDFAKGYGGFGLAEIQGGFDARRIRPR